MEIQYIGITIAIAFAITIGFFAGRSNLIKQWPLLITQIALLIIVSAVSFALGFGGRVWNTTAGGWQNIIVILIALGGAAFTYWRIRVLDKQRKISDEQVKNDKQKLHTDSYIRAVEQLGSAKNGENGKTEPNIAVRVGAIFGLEKIASENKDHTYQVLGLLSSYICEHAGSYESKEFVSPPRNDIYIALKSIGRLMEKNRPNGDYKPHLHNVEFGKTDLSHFELNYFSFFQAHLDNTVLVNAQLVEAIFIGTDFTLSHLYMANFKGASLNRANLVGADMAEAKNLTQEQINEAFGDGGTKLPRDLTAPLHWPHIALDISPTDISKSREEWLKWLDDQENYQPPQ